VIAKRCRRRKALLERAVYEHVLAGMPVPVARFYGYVESADGEECWLFMEDVGYGRYSNRDDEHRRAAGAWLGVLHTTAALVGPLAAVPEHGPLHYLQRLLRTLDGLRETIDNPALHAENRAVLRPLLTECETIAARWQRIEDRCSRIPRTLVHGDFTAKNIRVRAAATGVDVLPFDWGEAGWSVPCVDLAQSPSPAARLCAHPDVDAYYAVVREHWTDIDLTSVHSWARLGTLFRIILALQWNVSSMFKWLDQPLDWVCFYRELLARAEIA
jgi:aminoglycoside phosphotransferase (APT) family kinase protein